MPTPALRLLTALELLQANRHVSGAALADGLGVDRRTVRRYVARLEEMGIPVTSDSGRGGGYALVSGFKLPPMMFTDGEALALALGLKAARNLGLEVASAASAQAKLERVMPVAVRDQMRAATQVISLGLVPSPVETDSAVVAALSTAAERRRRVTITYRARATARTRRDVDPYGLAYRARCWYLVGRCHLRADLRSFRLDRVETVRVTDVSFVRSDPFDVMAHLTHSLATLPRAHAVQVLLKTDLASAQRRLFGAFGVLECAADGVVLHSQVEDLKWFARQLAALPFEFAIRQPTALRTAVASVARGLLRCAALTGRPSPL
jgi:predicted DNA-binding transcriptional regulator YafY